MPDVAANPGHDSGERHVGTRGVGQLVPAQGAPNLRESREQPEGPPQILAVRNAPEARHGTRRQSPLVVVAFEGQGFQRAAGFLRAQLGHRLLLRSVPQLHFTYDESVERGVRLSRLIDQANEPGSQS